MTNEELKALSPLSQFYIAQAMRDDLQNNELPDVADIDVGDMQTHDIVDANKMADRSADAGETMTERERFEAWHTSVFGSVDTLSNLSHDDRWLGWQAAMRQRSAIFSREPAKR